MGPILQDALRQIPGREANDYYRQYAGAVIGGERIVYVNGFFGGKLADALQWRTKAIGACDGGSNFFGAEYVEGNDTIRNLRFHGRRPSGAKAGRYVSSLNACTQSFRRKPGMHHSMHSGSIARAASAFPMSAVSQPN